MNCEFIDDGRESRISERINALKSRYPEYIMPDEWQVDEFMSSDVQWLLAGFAIDLDERWQQRENKCLKDRLSHERDACCEGQRDRDLFMFLSPVWMNHIYGEAKPAMGGIPPSLIRDDQLDPEQQELRLRGRSFYRWVCFQIDLFAIRRNFRPRHESWFPNFIIFPPIEDPIYDFLERNEHGFSISEFDKLRSVPELNQYDIMPPEWKLDECMSTEIQLLFRDLAIDLDRRRKPMGVACEITNRYSAQLERDFFNTVSPTWQKTVYGESIPSFDWFPIPMDDRLDPDRLENYQRDQIFFHWACFQLDLFAIRNNLTPRSIYWFPESFRPYTDDLDGTYPDDLDASF